MRTLNRFVTASCGLILAASVGEPGPRADKPHAATAVPVSGNRYALLVGCTDYPKLGKMWQLEGPGNDVVLMERVLREQFAFAKDHIVVLSEAEGRKDPKRLPTRDNIQREFEALPSKLHPGDRVVVLLGGHGSQQPEYPERKPNLPPERLEDDGLDELFLPRDTEPWNPALKVIPHAIIDDELHDWTEAIMAKGVSLWLIADSCHSGTLLRGVSEEKARQVTTRDGLHIPDDEMQAARARALKRGRVAALPGAAESPGKLEGAGDRLVALYAAQSSEVTVEMPMPIDDKGKTEVHGLLTYTVCKALAQSASPPTYRELVQRIRTRYDALNRTFPTPLVEGKDLDREVLGEKEFPGRGRFVLKGNADDGWKVSGGTLHGLTEKSILAVYDEADRKVGYVEISESRLLEADVGDPLDAAHWPRAAKVHGGWRCEPEYVHYGQQRLKVAAEFVADVRHPPATPEQQQAEAQRFRAERGRLHAELQSFVKAEGGSLLEVTTQTAQADCLVRADARTGKVYLVPAEGVAYRTQATPAEQPTPLVGASAVDRMAAELKAPLQRLARAKGLLALAPENERVRGESAVRVGVELIRLRNKKDRQGQVVPFQPGGLSLKDGDFIRLRVTNPNDFPVYPTLLFIDSGYGIQALYPESGQVAEAVEPKASITTGPMRVTSKTLGRERVVALAVKAGRVPVDFSFLEQPTIERARGAATRGTDPLDTPLGRLLQNAVYKEGSTRGMARVDLDEYGTALLSWQTRPAR